MTSSVCDMFDSVHKLYLLCPENQFFSVVIKGKKSLYAPNSYHHLDNYP